jgi:hypothetical protein
MKRHHLDEWVRHDATKQTKLKVKQRQRRSCEVTRNSKLGRKRTATMAMYKKNLTSRRMQIFATTLTGKTITLEVELRHHREREGEDSRHTIVSWHAMLTLIQ